MPIKPFKPIARKTRFGLTATSCSDIDLVAFRWTSAV
jgi:hypothetical protein